MTSQKERDSDQKWRDEVNAILTYSLVGQDHQGFEIFWHQNISAKCACKMLMKLTTGVNFINILCPAFTLADPKSAKRY